jgi:hypothetical protein
MAVMAMAKATDHAEAPEDVDGGQASFGPLRRKALRRKRTRGRASPPGPLSVCVGSAFETVTGALGDDHAAALRLKAHVVGARSALVVAPIPAVVAAVVTAVVTDSDAVITAIIAAVVARVAAIIAAVGARVPAVIATIIPAVSARVPAVIATIIPAVGARVPTVIPAVVAPDIARPARMPNIVAPDHPHRGGAVDRLRPSDDDHLPAASVIVVVVAGDVDHPAPVMAAVVVVQRADDHGAGENRGGDADGGAGDVIAPRMGWGGAKTEPDGQRQRHHGARGTAQQAARGEIGRFG